jgi:prepilin-type N-terminal cleavage/methylation domain-containing protein
MTYYKREREYSSYGFTLIELSIVLVIIGLIVGGVLAGQSLIAASAIRAQITQIEKFNAATNTFREKYGGLPGDLASNLATQFGFISRTGAQGDGNGNGVIEGLCFPCGNIVGGFTESGEPLLFWADLAQSKLIEGTFTHATGSSSDNGGLNGYIYSYQVYWFFPRSKLGTGFVYVYSGVGWSGSSVVSRMGGSAWFGISAISDIGDDGALASTPNLTVAQAYAMDGKVDDGLPLGGNVKAIYNYGGPAYAPNASTASSTTCFDTTSKTYSITQNNGNNVNCGISFKMQAGD